MNMKQPQWIELIFLSINAMNSFIDKCFFSISATKAANHHQALASISVPMDTVLLPEPGIWDFLAFL